MIKNKKTLCRTGYSFYFLHIICYNNMQKDVPTILTFCIQKDKIYAERKA